LSAICATFAVDYQRLGEEAVAYDLSLNALKAMDTQLEKNHMKRALNLKDLKVAHEQGQPVIIQDVEGEHFLEGHLDRVAVAYKMVFGLWVCSMTPTLRCLQDTRASSSVGRNISIKGVAWWVR